MVLRTMFGPKTDELGGHWRRLHNEELHGLYSSPNIVLVTKSSQIDGACRTCGVEQSCILGFRCLARKPEGNGPLGRPGCRWEGNIKMVLSRIEVGALTALISFRIGTLTRPCELGNKTSGSIKCGEFLEKLKTGQLGQNQFYSIGLISQVCVLPASLCDTFFIFSRIFV